jgi:hypothetical protein
MHWAALRRINALDSHLRRVLGIPILAVGTCCRSKRATRDDNFRVIRGGEE